MSPRAREVVSALCCAVVFGSACGAIADVEACGPYGIGVGVILGVIFGVWMERVAAADRAEALKARR